MKRRRLLDALEGVFAVALLVAIEHAVWRDAQRQRQRWLNERAAEVQHIVDTAYFRQSRHAARAWFEAWPDIDGWRERCQKGEFR